MDGDLGLRQAKQVGSFVAVDTAIDYFMGGVFAVPAAATLVVPQLSKAVPALSNIFSFGPVAMLEGPVIVLAVALVQRRLGQKPKLVADG